MLLLMLVMLDDEIFTLPDEVIAFLYRVSLYMGSRVTSRIL